MMVQYKRQCWRMFNRGTNTLLILIVGTLFILTSPNSQSAGNQNNPQTTSNSGQSFFLPYAPIVDKCKCSPTTGVDALHKFDPKQLYRKWFLYALKGTNTNRQQYYPYYLIINSQKLVYYGQCEVGLSPYTLDKNTLSGISPKFIPKKQTNCNANKLDQKVLKPFFDQIKYIDYAKTQQVPYILFYDKDFKHVATFHTETPTFPIKE